MKKPEQLPEMHNSILFNYNALVALDMHIMKNGEFIEICLFPCNSKYQLSKSKLPFYSWVKPRKSPYHLNGISYQDVYGVSEKKYCKAFVRGIDRTTLFDLFEKWFEEQLKILDGRKMMIITYDWPTKKPILLEWMGRVNFNHYFHFHIRDILPVALFFNDWAVHHIERPPFQKVDQAYICSSAGARYDSRDTLVSAAAIVDTYRFMINKMMTAQL